jgi:hypothetical protein
MFFYSSQFLHREIVMLIGKHINRYLLPFMLDFIVNEIEYELKQARRSGARTPKRR